MTVNNNKKIQNFHFFDIYKTIVRKRYFNPLFEKVEPHLTILIYIN